MKTKFLFVLISLFSFAFADADLFAQSKKAETSFKVSGNCGMCKRRIEAALDVNGVKLARWDVRTKVIEVVYNEKKINAHELHERIAAAGHDTDQVKSEDTVYAGLPFCCLYRDHDHSNIVDEPKSH